MSIEKELVKLNSRPLTILYTNPKKEEPRAYFKYNGQRYYFDQIIRVKNNPWVGETGLPDYIHGIETNHFYTAYIEILPDNEHVNLYWVPPTKNN